MSFQTTVEKKSSTVIDKIRGIIRQNELPRDEQLQTICNFLHKNFDVFDWAGFYLVDPDAEKELALGPFTGEPTEHTRIPFGKGICGQAANSHQPFVVQDVTEADNYLACSIEVKAEIVVPIMKKGHFVGELDIDSHTKNAITRKHRAILEEICDIVAELF